MVCLSCCVGVSKLILSLIFRTFRGERRVAEKPHSKGFCEMRTLHGVSPFEIREGQRHLQTARHRPPGHRVFLLPLFEKRSGVARQLERST